jgi:hypothetical protein
MLPLTLTLNGTIVLKGFSQVATQRAEPRFQMGEEVNFVNDNCKEREQVLAIFVKHFDCFFE